MKETTNEETGFVMGLSRLISEVERRINVNNILFFDLDGTLVETSYANFLAYRKAVQTVTGPEIDLDYIPFQRFNRNLLKKLLPHLSKAEYEKIIQTKENLYPDYLPQTKLIKSVASILLKYAESNRCILVSNCRKPRALMTLDHFGLTNCFCDFICRPTNSSKGRIDKYKNAVSTLGIQPRAIIAFENDNTQIKDAVNAGIPIDNIYICEYEPVYNRA